MSMYRVFSQYRAASGQLLKSLVRNNIMYFGASVALNILNIVGILLIPVVTWPTGIMEIAQILFQGLLATRMQLDLWKADCRAVESTMVTMSMSEFAVARLPSADFMYDYLTVLQRSIRISRCCRVMQTTYITLCSHLG
ncbi:hypothetical protein CY34DRAFT_683998 [Suillus luteus UH-Slu-Lm8-n1]|uniref:Uncharacterized protein n=1 Tax=Suillus luteus UH-Slu-Lm8-n1 TaxID=930992 RepID=A0A0D0A6L2_9AGAM|nr:hypothetical protein CY34DRAFT_683998 [Suillus luteus UH-Slu-Lm8-n1]